MPAEVILPRVDMDMAEGSITAWHAKEGDAVKQGEPLFDIETSKATMEVESPATGIVRRITASVGDTVPVGTVIAWIYASGEAVPEPDESTEMAVAEEAVVAQPVGAFACAPLARAGDEAVEYSGGLRATPAARRVARENRVPLGDIDGSGPHGRIVEADVLSFLKHVGAGATSPASLNRVWLQKGRAATLVLLHGFGAELNGWRPLFNAMREAALLPDIGVLSIDLPGHGKSPAEDANSFERIVRAVEAVLKDEQIDAFHCVAHSFGGAVAMGLAGRLGFVVRSLTLLAPAGLGESCNWAFVHGLIGAPDRTTLRGWLQELVHDAAFIDDAFVATAEQQLGRADRRATLARMAETFFRDGRQQFDMRPALAKLPMPVRVVWGVRDRILPIAHADCLPGRIAQYRFAEVGHLPHVEAVTDVAQIVGAQIAR
jgi:pimeloyl-ACP methyl ester carboxylesterase